MIALPRTITLRQEHDGADHRYLTARRYWSGAIRIVGQDLGPSTAMVSPDGEYEWTFSIPAKSVPQLRRVLGIGRHADVMRELAAHWCGPATYRLDLLLQELERSGQIELTVH